MIQKFASNNGQLERKEVTVLGRKFPLLELRKKSLADHEPYKQLNTDDEIEAMPLHTFQSMTNQYHHQTQSGTSTDELRSRQAAANIMNPGTMA